jgi:hypothetical protein
LSKNGQNLKGDYVTQKDPKLPKRSFKMSVLRSNLPVEAQCCLCTPSKQVIFRYFLEGKKCHFELR